MISYVIKQHQHILKKESTKESSFSKQLQTKRKHAVTLCCLHDSAVVNQWPQTVHLIG